MLQSCSHEMILRSLLKLSLFKLLVVVLDSRPIVHEMTKRSFLKLVDCVLVNVQQADSIANLHSITLRSLLKLPDFVLVNAQQSNS